MALFSLILQLRNLQLLFTPLIRATQVVMLAATRAPELDTPMFLASSPIVYSQITAFPFATDIALKLNPTMPG